MAVEGEQKEGETVPLAIREDALRKWAERDLSVTESEDGALHTRFNYLGTTCRNAGHEFNVTIHSVLRREDGGFRIDDVRVEVDPAQPGWLETCIHESNADPSPAALAKYSPAKGLLLDDFLSRDWTVDNAGCLCTSVHVTHKLILALATTRWWLEHYGTP